MHKLMLVMFLIGFQFGACIGAVVAEFFIGRDGRK